MPSHILHILAPVALLLPAAQAALPSGGMDAANVEAFVEEWQAIGYPEVPPLLRQPERGPTYRTLMETIRTENAGQVRIEQRLIIRIAPHAPGHTMLQDVPSGPVGPRFHERKTGRCLAVQGIAGVQVMDDRLVLYMRDRRIIGANLEKACRPRDFYSGFYVEQTSDGQICAGRDQVHSRAGATCSISGLRELIPND